METLKILHEENERVWERYVLAGERIAAFRKEGSLGGALKDYFVTLAGFITQLTNVVVRVFDGSLYEMEQKELQELNHALYADLLPENYDHCYGNPAYAVGQLGEEYGQVLSVVYSEIHSLTACAFEGRLCGLTCGMELLIELYNCFEVEGGYTGREIKEALYYYLHDYQEEFRRVSVQQKYDPAWGFAREIIMGAKLTDLRYLYFYGEYISENELKLAEYINSLPEETVSRMAFTYTDGYIRGFQTMGVDFSAKSIVNIRFAIGFERMIRKAVSTFEGMGKKVTIHRAAMNLAVRNYGYKDGFFATSVNPQYEYDHKNDMALCYDRKMQKTAVAAAKVVFDDYRVQCAAYAGPAALEVFGQEDFFPVNKKEAVQKDARATECMLEGSRELGLLMTDYIKSEETSYTIIAFPLPSIGEEFEEIFLETIRLNTLDNGLYQRMQQVLIDVLDTGERVLVRGGNGNRTNMVVCLHQLTDPASQTNFENCTADVNIPVGEVFTSPVLTGTNGVLHVGRVFLNGLEYRELEFTFVDGMVTDYKCANFEDPAENRRYIFDNILYGHETLPIGEFAIGTNRIAYEMGRKYGIQPKLPILIAEKTGPHFALGDTCYKRSEDHAVFNPDGKEIIARDNEISLLRRTDPAKAYMNCHTDITLPYDGLAEISVLQPDGRKVVLLKDGEFVLAGAKGLNVRE
ncbi:MAG: aminopeptidase [Lachnospiraceae bacterium]|nr:aminopeptidase [Lachnospiraceae bacterium]